jgi:hypothetical protein
MIALSGLDNGNIEKDGYHNDDKSRQKQQQQQQQQL